MTVILWCVGGFVAGVVIVLVLAELIDAVGGGTGD